MEAKKKRRPASDGVVTLKAVAQHLNLSPGTVSAVLNDAPSAKHIPAHTRERIHAAARELNYRPNYIAQSLRKKRTYTIGVIAHDVGEDFSGLVLAGVENYVRQKNYFFVTGIHRHNPDLFDRYADLLLHRGVEGFVTVDLNLQRSLPLPTVAVAGHASHEGVTNIVLDQGKAAVLAIQHLVSLGHCDIAVIRGNPASSDAEDRWRAVCDAAAAAGVPIRPQLTVQIDVDDSSPQMGYPYTRELLARKQRFTALFAYNDIAAIGAIRALQEAGLQVPRDVSVVGFDDIPGAAFHFPSLTTVRQPLRRMGEIAAQILLERIEGKKDYPREIAVEPELVIRESTAQAPTG
ncbi:MAG TPA: LacI family DNA-binding transcriptional regulator [Terriglobales bacterium]|nr:LacI family DNA-binding transcriptional regulator [Terriglobales bacterium]